jgi:hypothetical protein
LILVFVCAFSSLWRALVQVRSEQLAREGKKERSTEED